MTWTLWTLPTRSESCEQSPLSFQLVYSTTLQHQDSFINEPMNKNREVIGNSTQIQNENIKKETKKFADFFNGEVIDIEI